MIVKIVYDGTKSLLEIAKFCGVAPCQILIVNKLKNERELQVGSEILVPVVLNVLVRS